MLGASLKYDIFFNIGMNLFYLFFRLMSIAISKRYKKMSRNLNYFQKKIAFEQKQ